MGPVLDLVLAVALGWVDRVHDQPSRKPYSHPVPALVHYFELGPEDVVELASIKRDSSFPDFG